MAPRTPAFSLLASTAAAAAASHATAIALLPLLVAPDAPALSLALALACFHLPALALHPALHAAPPPRPAAALAAAVALDAVAALLFARAAATAPLDATAAASGAGALVSPLAALPRALAAGMAAAGAAAALFQDQLIRHVAAALPVADFHHDLGVHLAVVEGAAVAAAAAAPLAAAVLAGMGLPLHAFFLAAAALLLAMLPFAARVLLREGGNTRARGVAADARGDEEEAFPPPLLLPDAAAGELAVAGGGRGAPLAPALRRLLAQPAVALPLVAMVFASASAAFLRPLLGFHVLADMHRTPLYSAAAFALLHTSVLLTSNGATVACGFCGRRPLVIAGLVAAAAGFRALTNAAWTLPALALLAGGANTALVLTLGDVAEAADCDVSGTEGDAVTFVSFLVMAAGEAAGVLVAGALQDRLQSFASAARTWSYVLVAVVALLLVAELVDSWRSFFGTSGVGGDAADGAALRSRARKPASADETQALLAPAQ